MVLCHQTVQPLFSSEGARRRFYHITVILQYFEIILKKIKRSQVVETYMRMLKVYSVWSLKDSAPQALGYKFSLFEFPC